MHRRKLGAAAGHHEVDVAPPTGMNDVAHRRKKQIDPFRLAEHTDITDQELAPFAPGRIGGKPFDACEIWTGADHEDPVRAHAAALDGDAPVGLVRGNGDVGGLEGEPLREPHQLP